MLKLGSQAQTVRVSSPSAVVVSASLSATLSAGVDSAGVEAAELLALLPQPASMEAVRAAAIRAATFFFFMDLSSLKILFLHLL